MYKLSDNIRIRKVDELSFIINISNNAIISVKTDAVNFLLDSMTDQSIEETMRCNDNFAKFVKELLANNIIEVI